MLKVKQTTRKFYNKWLYKVTLHIPGVALFRLYKLEDIGIKISESVAKNTFSTMARAIANKDTMVGLANLLIKYDPALWTKRIESNSIDLYTNDLSFYKEVINEFKSCTVHCFEPVDASLLSNASAVLVTKFPHNRYQYKVYLLPHKIADTRDKHIYLDWVEGQGHKVLLSEAVKRWFIATNWNWDRRYVLVEDEATLLMLKLRNAEVVGRIYEYVIVDK